MRIVGGVFLASGSAGRFVRDWLVLALQLARIPCARALCGVVRIVGRVFLARGLDGACLCDV